MIRRAIPALLTAFLLGCGAPYAPPALYPTDGDHREATVERIVDGDTLVATVDAELERVRILAVDAPEFPRGGQPGECGAQSATDHVTLLAPPGAGITLVDDVEQPSHDRWGRVLAYVRTDDDVDLSLDLVEHGWAEVYEDRFSTGATPQLLEAQQRAQANRIGIWGEGCPP